MFTQKDIDKIDIGYFKVITTSPFAITLESAATTGHQWHLILKSEAKCKPCEVYHRHKTTDSWHRQWAGKAFSKALEAIREHDQFQMSDRRQYGG